MDKAKPLQPFNNVRQGETLTPVYSLKMGDTFKADDGQWWKVNEIVAPAPSAKTAKAYQILASHGQSNRRFYHYGSKLVTLKGK